MKKTILTLSAVGCGLVGLVFAVSTQAHVQKISPKVREAIKREAAEIPVLVYLNENADLSGADLLVTREEKGQFVYDTLRTSALKTQAELIAYLNENSLKHESYYVTNMVAVFGASASQIEDIAKRPEVRRVSSNAPENVVPPSPIAPAPLRERRTEESAIGDNIVSTGASKVWTQFNARGQGITIAGQDTGVEWAHPALKPQYRGLGENNKVDHNYNWHDAIRERIPGAAANSCGYNTMEPCDDNDHGSHTMGSMVGDDGAANKIGMAPESKWMACRNMDAGTGRPNTYIECFEFFLAPYPLGGNSMTEGVPAKAPHVINNSWGCPGEEGCKGDEFIPILRALKAAGVMVVVSAGNDGPSCSTIQDGPAHYTLETFSVGAFNHRTGKIASFSSRGPSAYDAGIGPDVVAPGEDIRSSVTGGRYAGAFWSGTSMAGPHVAGLVALLWSARPEYVGQIDKTIERIRSKAVRKTSTQVCGGVSGDKIPNNTFGYGAIDAFATVAH